jgi:hypothetical protein
MALASREQLLQQQRRHAVRTPEHPNVPGSQAAAGRTDIRSIVGNRRFTQMVTQRTPVEEQSPTPAPSMSLKDPLGKACAIMGLGFMMEKRKIDDQVSA